MTARELIANALASVANDFDPLEEHEPDEFYDEAESLVSLLQGVQMVLEFA